MRAFEHKPAKTERLLTQCSAKMRDFNTWQPGERVYSKHKPIKNAEFQHNIAENVRLSQLK